MDQERIPLKEFMNMLYNYDVDTCKHCERVAVLCEKVSTDLDYPQKASLVRAASVHDIGKILVPINILHKNTKLNRLDRLVVSSHAHWGYEILSTSELTEVERQFVLYHHGFTNFPVHTLEGLNTSTVTISVDNDILEGSLILQACDIYDAITTKRPYHEPLEAKVAFKALREKHIPERIIRSLRKVT